MIRKIFIGVCIMFFSVSPVLASSFNGWSTNLGDILTARWTRLLASGATISLDTAGATCSLTTTSGSNLQAYTYNPYNNGGNGGQWALPSVFSFGVCLVNYTAGGTAEAYLGRGAIQVDASGHNLGWPIVGAKISLVSGTAKLYVVTSGTTETATEVDSSFAKNECHTIRVETDPDNTEVDFFIDNDTLTPDYTHTTDVPVSGNAIRAFHISATNKNTATMFIFRPTYFTFEPLREEEEIDFSPLVILLVLLIGWLTFKLTVDLFKRVH